MTIVDRPRTFTLNGFDFTDVEALALKAYFPLLHVVVLSATQIRASAILQKAMNAGAVASTAFLPNHMVSLSLTQEGRALVGLL